MDYQVLGPFACKSKSEEKITEALEFLNNGTLVLRLNSWRWTTHPVKSVFGM